MNLKFAHLHWLWLPVLLAALLFIRWSSTATPVTLAVDKQSRLLASGKGSIIGLITDTVTGKRLVGVTVLVDGQTTVTNGVGVYRFDNVTEGLQVVVASFPNYLTAQKSRVVVSGELVWNSIALTPGVDSTATATPTLSPIPSETVPLTPTPTVSPTATPLPPTETPAAGTGTLIGLITNADISQAVVGVVVSANGQVVLTNDRGIYILAGLPPGEQLVSAQHPDFQPAAKVGFVVADTTRWNSFAMVPMPTPAPTHTAMATSTPTEAILPTNTALPSPTIAATNTPFPTTTDIPTATYTPSSTATAEATPEPGSLMGLITDVKTGERLAGVLVSTAGLSIQTQDNGFYLFENLSPGSYLVSAEHPDFQPAQQTGFVVSNEDRWNSIALTPREQPTPTATPTVPPSPTPTDTPLPTATSAATALPSSTPTQTPTVSPSPTPTTTDTPMPSATPTQNPFGTLAGIITDAETGEPLADVTVSVAGQSMTTDGDGAYHFETVPEGLQIVRAEKDGYQPGEKSQVVVANEVHLINIELTKIFSGCPTNSEAVFDLIPIQNPASEPHPDYLHGDLNLAQRGYSPTDADLSLQDYAGGADPNAPQLAGLFEPNSFPGITTVYRVNHWEWGCGEHGCRGEPITDWPVTLLGLPTTPGQAIHIPKRASEIFGGEFKAMVLYAEEQRITLGYTRDDTVASGYAVHLENVCVDPNLLALYRAQNDDTGFRATNFLPALRNNQKLGVASNGEIQVAIRDRGAFMDPRSRKDWWQGF